MMTVVDQGYAVDTTWRTLLRDMGIRPADVLRRAGLADDLLNQPSVRLASADYHRLWMAIEEETGDPLLPIRVAEAARAESFSPVLFAALCSPNLLVAAKRIGQYKALIGPIRFAVTETPGAVIVEMTWPNPVQPPASMVAMELLFVIALGRMGTRERIVPLAVTTPSPPNPTQPTRRFSASPSARGPPIESWCRSPTRRARS